MTANIDERATETAGTRTDVSVDIVDVAGKKSGTAELPGAIFDTQTNIPLIHQVVVAQLAAGRQGTHDTKTRGEVRGGGAKPWRQKGTGRARQGSRRAPQWTGGGVVHGPTPHGYSQRTPKKMVAAALRGVLSDRARDGRIHVVSGLAGETPNTKAAVAAVRAVAGAGKVLVVLTRDEDVAYLSLRNVADVHPLAVDQLNAYDVLVGDSVVFTEGALEQFVAGPQTGKGAKATARESEASSGAAGATVADTTADEADAPFGEGSYRGENPPAGFEIKGNEDSMKFHTPDSPWYARTIAEVWFASAEAAERAGFVNAVAATDDSEDDK